MGRPRKLDEEKLTPVTAHVVPAVKARLEERATERGETLSVYLRRQLTRAVEL